jgi:hypothetical protein
MWDSSQFIKTSTIYCIPLWLAGINHRALWQEICGPGLWSMLENLNGKSSRFETEIANGIGRYTEVDECK